MCGLLRTLLAKPSHELGHVVGMNLGEATMDSLIDGGVPSELQAWFHVRPNV